MPATPYIAQTDQAWFEFLSSQATAGRLDEANFWSPKSLRPLKRMRPGEPVFLRLKKPSDAIAGFGFFAHFSVLSLAEAWEFFGWKNGDASELSFLGRLGKYRGVDLLDPSTTRAPLGCTVLRDLSLWPRERWIPWGQEMGWSRNVVRGSTETDPVRASRLLGEILYDHLEPPAELVQPFELVDVDRRRLVESRSVAREGQGTFRARLLDAYGRRCAITGERTEPVLDAAHIQPYLGPRSNHMQNGLILTKEFHTLFDRGYVTVTPDSTVRISGRLREDWENGRRYYEFDGRSLARLPDQAGMRPSREALEWHGEQVFLG